MKSKAVIAFLLICVILTGCGGLDTVECVKDKIPLDYTATYSVSAANGIEYTNIYTVKAEDGNLLIDSVGTAPYYVTDNETGETSEEGVQTITASSRLIYDEGAMCGMPQSVTEAYQNSADEKQNTSFEFVHDHSLKMGTLTTRSNGSGSLKENVYTVSLTEQYFDKDSLAFIISAFSEQSGVIKISSGNRDTLQAVKFERLENTTEETPFGDFECLHYRITPNTDFTVYSADIYCDASSGIPVKIVHGTTTTVLTALETAIEAK